MTFSRGSQEVKGNGNKKREWCNGAGSNLTKGAFLPFYFCLQKGINKELTSLGQPRLSGLVVSGGDCGARGPGSIPAPAKNFFPFPQFLNSNVPVVFANGSMPQRSNVRGDACKWLYATTFECKGRRKRDHIAWRHRPITIHANETTPFQYKGPSPSGFAAGGLGLL